MSSIFQEMSTRLILQGEVGIWEGVVDLKLHTSTPNTCTVVTLYSEEKKIGAMSHIDDYTSVEHVFYTLNEQAQHKFGCSLAELDFKANIIGGTDEAVSKSQQQKVINFLESNNILYKKISPDEDLTEKRPQIVLNTANGAVDLLYGDRKNYRLEYLQQREYLFFNAFQLDREYGSLPGCEIPDFEALQSIRSEHSLPKFPMADVSKTSIDAALALEDSGQIRLPITSWRRTAITTKDVALRNLNAIMEKFKKNRLLSESHRNGNLNLLLRQSCSSQTYIELTQFLTASRFALNVDLNSKGKTSGTALDVAVRSNNLEAIKAIKTALHDRS